MNWPWPTTDPISFNYVQLRMVAREILYPFQCKYILASIRKYCQIPPRLGLAMMARCPIRCFWHYVGFLQFKFHFLRHRSRVISSLSWIVPAVLASIRNFLNKINWLLKVEKKNSIYTILMQQICHLAKTTYFCKYFCHV